MIFNFTGGGGYAEGYGGGGGCAVSYGAGAPTGPHATGQGQWVAGGGGGYVAAGGLFNTL